MSSRMCTPQWTGCNNASRKYAALHIGPGLPSFCLYPCTSYCVLISGWPRVSCIFFFFHAFPWHKKASLEVQLLVLTYKVYKAMMNVLGVLSTSYVVFLPPFSHILLRAVFCGSPLHAHTHCDIILESKRQWQHLERGCHCGAMSFLVNMMYVVNK